MTSGPQKAVLPESSLPPITVFEDGTFGYRLRYRFVSLDSNRFSHYSPIYTVNPSYEFKRPAGKGESDFNIVRQGPYVNVIWDAVSVIEIPTKNLIKIANRYDIWLRWSQGESNALWVPADPTDGVLLGVTIPSFYQTSTSGVISTINEEPTRLSVEIYIRATNQSRSNTPLLVYSATNTNIEPPTPPPAN
jgi:hypothetical protein